MHEHRREQPEQHDPGGRVAPHRAHPVDHEARPARRTSSTLPSSEGWKLKPGSGIHDLAPRVAVRDAEHQQHEADHQPVDRIAQLAQPRVVEPRDAVHEHEADAGVDRLAVDVVVRVARRCRSAVAPLSAISERGDEAERGEQQQRVQAQAPLPRHERGRRLGGRLDRRRGAHRVWLDPAWKLAVVQIEPLGEDQARRGCRSLRTESAALDGRDDHDRARRVRRRRRRTRTGRGSARARPCRSCRRPGSAEALEDVGRGAALLGGGAAQAVHDRRAVGGGEARPGAAARVRMLLHSRPGRPRPPGRGAGARRGRRWRSLRRRSASCSGVGLQVALADGEVDVVALRPRRARCRRRCTAPACVPTGDLGLLRRT